ncbi:MAG TPA: hypothetical protein VFH73_14655 [Polyangia bacterium]|jgi:hypothetical protein|nr:hypothetical protein [Polyangia bacterium]
MRAAAGMAVCLVAALALAAGGGCGGSGEASPESAVAALIATARAGDRLGVYQHFGPRTRGRIDEMLAGARKTGGTRMLRPEDLVTVGWVPPAWEAAGTRLIRREGNEAEVEVYSVGGDRQTIRVVREDKLWKVELPLR